MILLLLLSLSLLVSFSSSFSLRSGRSTTSLLFRYYLPSSITCLRPDGSLFDGRNLSPTMLSGVLSRADILKHSTSSSTKTKQQPRSSNTHHNHGKNKNKRSMGATSTSATNIRRKSSLVGGGNSETTIRTCRNKKLFLLDAIEEGVFRQTTALECLREEHRKITMVSLDDNDTPDTDTDTDSAHHDNTTINIRMRDTEQQKQRQRRYETIQNRTAEIDEQVRKLKLLKDKILPIKTRSNSSSSSSSFSLRNGSSSSSSRMLFDVIAAEQEFRSIMSTTLSIGSSSSSSSSSSDPVLSSTKSATEISTIIPYCSILDRPQELWKIHQNRNYKNGSKNSSNNNDYGRPRGFEGLVFQSPLGVPCLVGKRNCHKDETLRRVAQGADLWFQSKDYHGSRVLLRSSLVRGTKNSKRCLQFAADLAATYSALHSQHQHHEHQREEQSREGGILIMYTDSKNVAKRGGKVGSMKKKKSFGTIVGYPANVHTITNKLEP